VQKVDFRIASVLTMHNPNPYSTLSKRQLAVFQYPNYTFQLLSYFTPQSTSVYNVSTLAASLSKLLLHKPVYVSTLLYLRIFRCLDQSHLDDCLQRSIKTWLHWYVHTTSCESHVLIKHNACTPNNNDTRCLPNASSPTPCSSQCCHERAGMYIISNLQG